MVHMNVEKIRTAKGVTKTHIAKKLGKTLQGYRHMASGSVKIGAEELMVIADALAVDIRVFFDNKLTETVIKKIKDTLTA